MNDHRDGSEVGPRVEAGNGIPRRAEPFLAGAWPLGVLLLLATLPYIGILRNDFAYAYDDKAQIIDNPYVHSFGHLREALATTVWSFKDGSRNLTNYYRPIMTSDFFSAIKSSVRSAYGFHLASLLLHAAVVTILFLFAERLFRATWRGVGRGGPVRAPSVHVEAGGVDFRRDRPRGDLLLSAHLLVLLAGCGRGRRRETDWAASRHDGEFRFWPSSPRSRR